MEAPPAQLVLRRAKLASWFALGLVLLGAASFAMVAVMQHGNCGLVEMRLLALEDGTCRDPADCERTLPCQVWRVRICNINGRLSSCEADEFSEAWMCHDCALDALAGKSPSVGDVFTGACPPDAELKPGDKPEETRQSCEASDVPATFGPASVEVDVPEEKIQLMLGTALAFSVAAVVLFTCSMSQKRKGLRLAEEEEQRMAEASVPSYDDAIYGEEDPRNVEGYGSVVFQSGFAAFLLYSMVGGMTYVMLTACSNGNEGESFEEAGMEQFLISLALILVLCLVPAMISFCMLSPREAYLETHPRSLQEHKARVRRAKEQRVSYAAPPENKVPFRAPRPLIVTCFTSAGAASAIGLVLTLGIGSCPGGYVSAMLTSLGLLWMVFVGYFWSRGGLQVLTRTVTKTVAAAAAVIAAVAVVALALIGLVAACSGDSGGSSSGGHHHHHHSGDCDCGDACFWCLWCNMESDMSRRYDDDTYVGAGRRRRRRRLPDGTYESGEEDDTPSSPLMSKSYDEKSAPPAYDA